jgi:DNA-binding NarL/FixJ family response regulator
MKRARILLADDHEICCEGFRKVLEPKYEVLGCVSDGRTLVRSTLKLKPDVVVLDIGMPLLNGLDTGREIKKMLPRTMLIFMTMNLDPSLAAEALRIGASAYLLKTSRSSELPAAVGDALKGITYITAEIRRMMDEAFIRDPKGAARAPQLTNRQREVLQLLAEGKQMKEVAYILDVTLRTVQFHKYSAMEELGITSNAELVQYAMRHGMISTT